MVDCSDTNSCAVPLWGQYVILIIAFCMFVVRACLPKDPYDRM